MERKLDSLEQGDRIRVTLSDGTELVGKLQNDPDTGPPTTADGRAAGWDVKTLLGGVHVEEVDGTDYESLMLTQERYGDEWSEVEVYGYRYDDGDYVDDLLSVEEVGEA